MCGTIYRSTVYGIKSVFLDKQINFIIIYFIIYLGGVNGVVL